MSEVEELNEDALFEGVTSDETPEVPVVVEEPVEQPETPAETPEEPVGELTAEKPPIPPKPEYRLKEDAEARRRAETDLANERAEKAALKQRLEALERANQPTPPKIEKVNRPDPLLDPEGYADAIRQELREERLNEVREESLLRARGETAESQAAFDEAYAAARQAVDPALKARMQATRDPGKTLLEWHRENKVKAEVGNDPNAWLEKKLEERLKDPTFLAKAVELARGSASPQQNGRPRVDLPPSLNGASRSNAALRSANDDVSDDALWEQTTG